MSNGINMFQTNPISAHKIREYMVCIILFCVPFLFFFPVVFSDIEITMSDGIGYKIMQVLFRQVIKMGEFPLWNKYVALGTSNIGDIQNKVLYPLTWICALFPNDYSFKVLFVIHISLALIFSYLLCREINCDIKNSLFGASLFSTSNLIIIRYEHINILCCLVWIPLIVLLIIRYYNRKEKKYLLITGLIMSLQFYAGFPQTALYSDIFVAIIMIYLSIKHQIKPKMIIRDFILLFSMYLVLCMAQLLPLAEITKYSGRTNISYEYFADGSAHVLQLFDLVSPDITGSFGSLLPGSHEFPTDMYLGVIPLVLIIYSIIYLRKNTDVRFLFWYSIGAFLFSCACSNFPPLGRIIFKIPVIGSFRTTTRMLAFVVIPLLMTSIISLRFIAQNDDWKKMAIISIAIAGIIFVFRITVKILHERSSSEIIGYYATNNVGLKSMILLIILTIGICICSNKYIITKYSWLLACFVIILQVADVYFVNTDLQTKTWRMPYLLSARRYHEVFDSDVRDVLTQNRDGSRYFVNFDTWDDLHSTSWSIRPNGNIDANLSMIQSYITFNNVELLKLANTSYGMMMNTNEIIPNLNKSLIDFLNIGYVVTRKQHILYEEYENRNLKSDESIYVKLPFDKLHYSINIDADIRADGCDVNIKYDDGDVINLGHLSKDMEFYTFQFTPTEGASNVIISFPRGNNVILKGLRVNTGSPDIAILDKIFDNEEFIIYKNNSAAGNVFVAKNMHLVEEPGKFVVDNKNTINFTEDAYVDNRDDINQITNGAGSVDAIIEKNNCISAEVDIFSPKALVVFSESVYPGWKVYIDGKKENIISVDDLVQGVIVSKGKHSIIFKYEPYSVTVGAILSLCGLVLLTICILSSKRKKAQKL